MAEAAGLWDEARTGELRRLWNEGRSAGQIAEHLSGPGRTVTRNTICGKLHRLGLSRASAPPDEPPAPVVRAVPPKAARPEPDMPAEPVLAATPAPVDEAPPPAPDRAAAPVPADVRAVVPPLRKVTIQELKADMCRWPLGDPSTEDFRYCGNGSLAGRPYCAHHAVMAYEPPRQRSAR